MKSYSKIEDLLFDQSFKNWVFENEPADNLYWPKWIAACEGNYKLYKQAKLILIALSNQGKDMDDSIQRKLFDRIENSIQPQSKRMVANEQWKDGIWNYFWFRTAAILSFVLIASIAFLNIYSNKDESIKEEIVTIIKSNPKGQKSKLYLPDGTTVYLNAESEIAYKDNFGKDHRDIDLKGEAFFEVAHDTILPFRIQSGEMVTVALGTSFNINAYQDKHPSVQLSTGKVRVYSLDSGIKDVFLLPGEEAVLKSTGLSKGSFNDLYALGWKDGILTFTQMRFSEVTKLLERWYAVEIFLKNPPKKDQKVSGEFKDASLKNVLESLGYTMGFDYSINRKKITLEFKNSANE
ncbi:FecR family protein [Echinicola salinicaeni]|uniref:FecR family protein n=1 Tax=Echinicola salinicaeni TaxID=2762757 RepID=UPI0016482140|nr:FecR domain-containing protein [Echinicola salinicaeni]